MSKRNNIVYTEPIGKKGEYKIFSVKTKELLGTIKGENAAMYWEAFDTDSKFLMSGKRKKECMDCFREMDTKRLMAKGGGMDFEKLSNKVAKNYEGDKVAPKYQHEYGKTYSKEEAKEVGNKVAGKVYWQQQGRKMATGGGVEEYRAKAIERQRKEEEGKTFAPFRAFVYEDSYQFADFKTDDFHKAVKWAKETLEKQKDYRKTSENLWAIVDEFTPIEKRNNVIYAYSEVARFGEGDMKNMKFKNGGSMPSASKGFYIVLADGSKKEYSVNNITEIPNIYFAMGTNGIEKGTPMVHHDNILTSVYYANGTPVEAMPQYAGKDYYDFKKKMADGGNVDEDEDYYRVFRNNAGKDIAVKIVKNPIFGKFDYYVDGSLRGQFDSFAQARQEVNYENFDMYKEGGSIEKGNYAFVEAETTTGEKVFKFFEDVPTHKEVYAYFRSCKNENGKPMTLKDATIHIEKVSSFDRELFLEKANEIAIKQFGSPIEEIEDLMFAYDKENLSVFKFEAELENGMEVSIEATDGVIIIEAEKDEEDDLYKDGGNLHSSEFYAKGGLVVTSINDIPNFKEENEAGRITYRGLGMGKLSDDFYKIAGEGGTRIKVKGKEYFITDTEFNTFSRDSSGKMRIRFDAPFRKLR